jgi:hypothetical protein
MALIYVKAQMHQIKTYIFFTCIMCKGESDTLIEKRHVIDSIMKIYLISGLSTHNK